MCFDIEQYYEDENVEVINRIPITDLIDHQDRSFLHEDVTSAVNDWRDVAREFPYTRRSCLFCRTRTIPGYLFCSWCAETYGEIIESEDN